MTFFIISACGVIGAFLGRIIFGRWFNHVSLYSGIWALSLLLFELRLINYYPLQEETWLVIVAAWLSFICGSFTVSIARWATGKQKFTPEVTPLSTHRRSFDHERKGLTVVLWALNIITLLSAIQNWLVVVEKFGSVSNVLLRGALLYSLHVSEGISGRIPYLGSLCLVSGLLAGVYTAKVGKIKVVAILPIIVCILVDLSFMTRALMILTAIVFSIGYFLSRNNIPAEASVSRLPKLRRVLAVAVALLLLAVGAELARSTRHINENVSGATSTLQRLQASSFLTPTIYMYFTAHHGVLNQYLKHDDEKSFFGANTFAPVFRGLEKMGFDTYVGHYQMFYNTPVGGNTGTYIRELHADFGIAGVLAAPYLIGLFCSFCWYRFSDTRRYVHLVLLGYFLVIITMSVFYLATRLGYMLVYLIGSLIIAYSLDARMRRGFSALPALKT